MPRPAILLALAWTLLILALCSIPGDSLPESELFSYDKLGHAGAFAIFAWLWLRAATPDRTAWVLAGGVAFAIGTELYQGLLPFGRLADPLDALADLVGLLAGFLAYRLWTRWRAKQREAA